jgi:pSer/pThr/pTyr-binding forkhead associated (FHA) protein
VRHADYWRIADDESTNGTLVNGTLVNGVRVNRVAPIKAGDELGALQNDPRRRC